MGGEDLADQMLKYYAMERRSIKWYKKLFFHLLDIATHNAFVIFKTTREPTITSLKFRLRLIDEMLTAAGPDRAIVRGRPRSLGTDQARLLIPGQNHFPAFNEAGVSGNPKFRQCRVCNAANKRTAGGTRVRNETK